MIYYTADLRSLCTVASLPALCHRRGDGRGTGEELERHRGSGGHSVYLVGDIGWNGGRVPGGCWSGCRAIST